MLGKYPQRNKSGEILIRVKDEQGRSCVYIVEESGKQSQDAKKDKIGPCQINISVSDLLKIKSFVFFKPLK